MRTLITAGATREYIDPVRFISNASSGRMGYALVQAALKAGHKVTLITTVHRPSTIEPRATSHEPRATVVRVETASQMFDAVKRYFPRCDCLIMAAAVADYTPAYPAKTKIKKQNKPLTIKLKPTPDILKWAGTHKTMARVVVGFALEDKNLRPNAERKLRNKNLDMIIANTPAAIGKDRSAVQVKTLTGDWLKLPFARKEATAVRLVRLIERLF
jgi:phosphopantothenoylcysteine synthetase/decarboxylase